VLEAMGYFPVDLGALDVGGRLAELPFGSLAATNFIKIWSARIAGWRCG